MLPGQLKFPALGRPRRETRQNEYYSHGKTREQIVHAVFIILKNGQAIYQRDRREDHGAPVSFSFKYRHNGPDR